MTTFRDHIWSVDPFFGNFSRWLVGRIYQPMLLAFTMVFLKETNTVFLDLTLDMHILLKNDQLLVSFLVGLVSMVRHVLHNNFGIQEKKHSIKEQWHLWLIYCRVLKESISWFIIIQRMRNRYNIQINRIRQYPISNVNILSHFYDPEGGIVAKAMLIAPSDSIYKHHRFNIEINGKNFPFKPPTITFLTKIYHPNIDPDNGTICICNIPEFNYRWAPTYSIGKMLGKIVEMIEDPGRYLTSCKNKDIVQLYIHNREQFVKKVEEWCQIYCEKE